MSHIPHHVGNARSLADDPSAWTDEAGRQRRGASSDAEADAEAEAEADAGAEGDKTGR